MTTDTTFFTNEPNSTLVDRFKVLLKHSQFLDIIVGYFRISGFNLLKDSFENIDEVRILNGINVDKGTIQAIEIAENKVEIYSEAETKAHLKETIRNDLENSDDTEEISLAIKKFIELLRRKKIKIKQHRKNSIHAKVYICRLNQQTQTEYGKVITGSSNFSYRGLKGQYEFNVELKNSADVKYALEKFNELWNDTDSIDVNNYVEEILKKETWINEEILPYELYLKVLYEHFKDEINQDKKSLYDISGDVLKLKYQKHAVIKAKDILDTYNGVFIADVVGLGKTYVSGLLAKQLPDVKKTIICPPILKENWKRVFDSYKITQFDIFSGDGQILKKLKEHYFVQESEYIFIDEAHRFRNAETETYNDLYELCEGKKVILVTATPLNNKFLDILSQLRLFLKPRSSNIPGVSNLNSFFNYWDKKVRDAKRDLKDEEDAKKYLEVVRQGSEDIREKVLSEVMVRRTRTDIEELYQEDMEKNDFHFPDVDDPIRLVYEFDKQTNGVFEQTLLLFKEFKKVRYNPLNYLKPKIYEKSKFSKNDSLGSFFKTLIIKRLESSKYAFQNTIRRFIDYHKFAIQMYENDKFIIGIKNQNIYDLQSMDDDEKIQMVDEGNIEIYNKEDFKPDFIELLKKDLQILEDIQVLWNSVKTDFKLKTFIKELKTNEKLNNKKIIIFSESKETCDDLFKTISKEVSDKCTIYTSGGGKIIKDNKVISLSYEQSRKNIAENFDPNISKKLQKDDISILISTEVLSEGVDLHRSNIVINYDLPWNPTRVIQRVGRVNRVGSKFKNILIFNFFPSEQGGEILNQEENITSKIQAIHDCLGNDAKYLTEDEETQTYYLLGGKSGKDIFNTINNKDTYDNKEETVDTRQYYINFIRQIRDNNSELFNRIKELPKKIKTAKKSNLGSGVITFFRKGRFKEFVSTDDKNKETKRLNFLNAIKYFQCKENDKKNAISKSFFDLLRQNKNKFSEILKNATFSDSDLSSNSNEFKIISLLNGELFQKQKTFSDDDNDLLLRIRKLFDDGRITPFLVKKIIKKLKELDDKNDSLKTLYLFKDTISPRLIRSAYEENVNLAYHKKEIILSLNYNE